MPTGLSFVDTNILLYRASQQDERKRRIATALLDSAQFGLSTQVLQEFYAAAIHPAKLALTHAEVLPLLQSLLEYPVHVVNVAAIQRALVLKQRYQTSYWDAAILASAEALGCRLLYTEDLNHGQSYEGVRVVNPFQKISAV